ncbi:MAG: hypothetical protein Q9191_005067 [Dirinaria sp. TL-2023a]
MVSKAERRRSIFLTARRVFVGSSAQIRDRKAIAAVVAQHGAIFQKLNESFGKESVIGVLLSLLDNGIFDSELKAKLAFPELFQVSAVRSLQHDASEQHAAQSEAEAFDRISLANENGEEDDIDVEARSEPNDKAVADTSAHQFGDVPSLYPAYLVYEVQHKLLNKVQALLEQSCYSWAKKWVPALLEEQNWTCPEAVELLKWSKILPKRFGKLSSDATTLDSSGSLREILKATHILRHAAVHRVPTSAKGIEKMLKSALNLANALRDTRTRFKIEHILKDFQERVAVIELYKNQLENQLDQELCDIREQRAALDRREKEAKAEMKARDHEHTTKLSWLIEASFTDITQADMMFAEGKDQGTSADGDLESITENVAENVQPVGLDGSRLDKTINSMTEMEANGGAAGEISYAEVNCIEPGMEVHSSGEETT